MAAASLIHRVKSLLAEPLAAGLDLDDPSLTAARRDILRRKPFLRAIYAEWYGLLARNIPAGPGEVLELGSGAGFAAEFIPGLRTSEIFWLPGLDLVMDGCALPLPENTLKALVFTDVLHHIPRVGEFFTSAARCLRPGGVIAMIEPWVCGWSRFVYRNLHHEPFRPEAAAWEFETSGPLSGANGALPWMVFARDRARFEAGFPELAVETVRPMQPLSYLLSGGLSMRGMAPAAAYRAVRAAETVLERGGMNMFALIVLRRK